MDRQKAKILFDLLRSSSSEKVIKGLNEIKKRLQTNEENIGVFSNFGLAKQCLKLIQRPNEAILNGTLSVLSIICTDQSARTEIYDNNGVLHLHNVLKGTKSETLQLRVCRTIANQSQHKASCDHFFNLGCPQLIINLVQQCKEDETKCASVRALRLLANNGDHCRKIVVEKGIYHLCISGIGSSNNLLILEVFKALAHFSRIPHPTSLKQIMEGTDNMAVILKIMETADTTLQNSILRTVLNIVWACSELKKQNHFHLTSSLMDNLAMARAPSLIVWELQKRKVPEISDEKLILALCHFCEGFGPTSNFNYPPLFVGRTWSQVLDCGGIHLFVTLLSKQHSNTELRSAILRALTGIEYVFSYKDKILKHLLAANMMPKLAEQFDDVIAEYRKVRREPQEGLCVHSIATVSLPQNESPSTSKVSKDQLLEVSENESNLKEMRDSKHLDSDKPWIADTTYQLLSDLDLLDKEQLKPGLSSSDTLEETSSSSYAYGGKLAGNTELGIHAKPTSPGVCSVNPLGLSSVSCSPRSNQSSSGSGPSSPTWSPIQNRCESLTFSPPFNSFASSSVPGQCPWESPTSSRLSSPCSSPTHYPPWLSPPRPTSPIRVPSDWEYEDDDMEDDCDDGRFSPTILKSKESEETEEDTDEMEEGDGTNTEDESTSTDEGSRIKVEEEGAIEADMKNRLVISSTLQKRSRDSASPTCSSGAVDPLEKKMKTGIDIEMCLSVNDPDNKDDQTPTNQDSSIISDAGKSDTSIHSKEEEASSPSLKEKDDSNPDLLKTPFIKLNQIKFRVRKKPRRQLSLEPEDNVIHSLPKQNVRLNTRRTSSVCSESAYSDLTADECKWLQLLELLVRVIGQIAFIKEAVNTVCREFVPRIMSYLSTAQVIHKSATRMLETIAKNALSIPILLDSLFIPYVAVELGEAGDPENPSGCSQCRILSDGAVAFLNEMVNFFNHVHLYGRCEVSNRLQPTREHSIREGCVMALPHVTRCPQLLYDFMVSYPAMDLLMTVLHSDRPPNDASYMYATAAISRLARTLQLDKQLQPVKCPVCSERRTHTPEEVAKHLRMQQEITKSQGETSGGFMSMDSKFEKSRQCKLKLDEVRDVTFKLEGGETLTANREFLSEKNDVLRRMLMGSFAEGSSPFVELPETGKTSLEMLLHFLYGCQCDFMENADFRSYLQLVFLSQMYMVEKLDAFAVLKMLSAINEGSDIVMLYESGLGHIDEQIVLQAICTTLVRPMKTWKRARWFKELFQSTHSEDIDHNIRVILHHPLDINRLVCNCDQSLSLYAAKESVYSKLQ